MDLSADSSARPVPRGIPVGPAIDHLGSLSRVAPVFLFYACHRHYPGGTPECVFRSLPQKQLPSPKFRRVGFRITLFEACATFIHITACIVAKSP
jgi:hypothetical protein